MDKNYAKENYLNYKSTLGNLNKLVGKHVFEYFPYRKNLFSFDFGTDDCVGVYVEKANYTNGDLAIWFRNCQVFFAPEYFEKKKQFEKIKIGVLGPTCEERATITFYDAEVVYFSTDPFDYKDDGVLCTQVIFNFKKVEHCNNPHNIEL